MTNIKIITARQVLNGTVEDDSTYHVAQLVANYPDGMTVIKFQGEEMYLLNRHIISVS